MKLNEISRRVPSNSYLEEGENDGYIMLGKGYYMEESANSKDEKGSDTWNVFELGTEHKIATFMTLAPDKKTSKGMYYWENIHSHKMKKATGKIDDISEIKKWVLEKIKEDGFLDKPSR